MFEFMLFDAGLKDRFLAFIESRGVTAAAEEDVIAGWVVSVPEDIPEDDLAAIEAFHEALMEEQEELVAQEQGGIERHLAGIRVTLSDGCERTVRLDARTAARLLEHFEPEEVAAIVEAVARGLEGDSDAPLCRGPVPGSCGD